MRARSMPPCRNPLCCHDQSCGSCLASKTDESELFGGDVEYVFDDLPTLENASMLGLPCPHVSFYRNIEARAKKWLRDAIANPERALQRLGFRVEQRVPKF